METIERDSRDLKKGERTRARVLEAAASLFAERGYRATPLREVAARAGIREPSLYNHFAGKEALYVAVLERGLRPLLDRLLAHLSGGEDLLDLPEAMLGLLAERPEVARLMSHELLHGGGSLDPLLGDWMRALVSEGLTAATALGEDETERMLTVIAMFNLIVGFVALAPALGALGGIDVAGEDALARQRRIVRRLGRALLSDEASS